MKGVVQRPPLPLGRSISGKTESQGSQPPPADEPPQSDLDTSESSRSSLRRSLLLRRPTLTMRETSFLERLIETGNEVEVQVAHENLLNEKLFFETVDDDYFASDDDGEAAFRASSIGSAPSSAYSKSMSSIDYLIAEDVAAYVQEENKRNICCGGSTDGLGSERRQELLQQRRMSSVHGKIWRAHESGLAVTPQGSRKSMMVRSKSFSKQIKTPNMRTDDIFRARPRRLSATRRSQSLVIPRFKGKLNDIASGMEAAEGELMDDTKSDNNRSRPVVPIGSPATQKPVRPSLLRRSSDASRKSVTFDVPIPAPSWIGSRAVSDGAALLNRNETTDTNEKPPRPKNFERETSDLSRRTESSVPSIHMAHPVRSYSIRSEAGDSSALEQIDAFKPLRPSSPPSIHHGRPIRSESMRSSQNSLPSLHQGKPIRSESMSSRQNSINTFDSSTVEWLEGRDPSNVKDEKKDDEAGIPDKVVIPTTGTTTALRDSQKIMDPESGRILRPVVMRQTSGGLDDGEGIEVADYDADMVRETAISPRHSGRHSEAWEWSSIHTSNSFDETMSYGRVSTIFRTRPDLERAMSDDDIRCMYLGDSRAVFRDSFSSRVAPLDDDEPSWRIDDDGMDYYDSWMVIEDEYINGYGGGGTLSFRILGTSAHDKSAMPHVLSPPLMESLQAFFPFNKAGESFWLKYSMVRDGASLFSLLRHARGSKYTIIAVETTDGEVFGSFTGEAWRKSWNYYGSDQSFVWRMRHTRREKAQSIIDQAHKESEIDVFPYNRENRCFQLCTDENIAVGGGAYDPTKSTHSLASEPDTQIKDFEWGPSLMLQDDLLQGTSYPCLTFGSPSLSKVHADGSLFEIINVEVWTLTPCLTLEEAEKLELGRLFLEKQGKFM